MRVKICSFDYGYRNGEYYGYNDAAHDPVFTEVETISGDVRKYLIDAYGEEKGLHLYSHLESCGRATYANPETFAVRTGYSRAQGYKFFRID